jgi:hypothetical protein
MRASRNGQIGARIAAAPALLAAMARPVAGVRSIALREDGQEVPGPKEIAADTLAASGLLLGVAKIATEGPRHGLCLIST